jgi:hypothetical protein
MALPQYSTGTVAVAAGGTVVTCLGGMWSGINVKQGDFISIANLAEVLITEVSDETHLKIAPWQGPAQTNAVYAIYQNYVGRVVGVAAAEDVGVMLEKLHTDGLPFILGAEETVPDPSYGDEGQLAFKPSTGEWWEKTGGVWVTSFGLTALGYGGTSATSLLIGTGTKTFTTQGSLAYDGARVRAASAANPNNWMEGVADYFGTTLTMTSDKIGGSGTHADWLFSIAGQPGADGIGAGDVIGPASAVIDNIATFAATTGKQIKDGGVKISNLVRYDIAQTLTEAQKVQARSNIYAAPLDALSYSGMQINGSMEVSQENGATAVAFPTGTVEKYTVDGMIFSKTGTSTFTVQQVASVFPSYANELKLTVTAAQAGIGSDAISLRHKIEGYRLSRLGWGTASARPLTIGVWVKSSVAGNLPIIVYNSDFTSTVTATLNIATANVAQFVTVTISGPTTGVWKTDNNIGANIVMFIAAAGSVNIVATNGNTFEITGLIVLPGIEAPSAERSPLIMRPYDQELVTCQRCWEKVKTGAAGYTTAGGSIFSPVSFKATKRTAPTGLVVSWGTTANATGQTLYDIAVDSAMFSITAATTGTLIMRDVLATFDARL